MLNPARLAPATFFVAAALTLSRDASATDFGRALSDAEVTCEENQGHQIVLRQEGTGGSGLHSSYVWRSTPGGGVFRGLAVVTPVVDTHGSFLRDERQLAFDLVLKSDEDYLDPRRTRLPQATFARRDASSNLEGTPPASGLPFAITFDLAHNSNPINVGVPLRITGLPTGSRATGSGRIVEEAGLTAACHEQVSEFDLRVESILARTVRPACESYSPIDCALYSQYKAVIFRGEEPLSYRMDLYGSVIAGGPGPTTYSEVRIPLLFHVQVDGEGALTSGDVQILPFCSHAAESNCTTNGPIGTGILVLPPVLPGGEVQGPEVLAQAAKLRLGFKGDPHAITFAVVDWHKVLEGTSWSR